MVLQKGYGMMNLPTYMDAKYAGVIVGVDLDIANAENITNWCKNYWSALHPYSTGGAYSDFI